MRNAGLRQISLILSLILSLCVSSVSAFVCPCDQAQVSTAEHSCCPPQNENHCPPKHKQNKHQHFQQVAVTSETFSVANLPCEYATNSAPPSAENQTAKVKNWQNLALTATAKTDFAMISPTVEKSFPAQNPLFPAESSHSPKPSRAPPVW